MSAHVIYNILFIAAVVAMAVGCWLIFYGIRRKRRHTQLDDTAKVNGIFQTGLNHRFNTLDRRR